MTRSTNLLIIVIIIIIVVKPFGMKYDVTKLFYVPVICKSQ